MKILYLDCFSGISGDMFAGAMLSLGADQARLCGNLALLPLKDFQISVTDVLKNSVSATDFNVILEQTEHSAHHHRSYRDIQKIILSSPLGKNIQSVSLRIFDILAQAEGKVHGVAPEEVQFHEVGAVDSIVDIVSAAALIDEIKPDRIVSSPLTEGTGTIRTQHGILPVPAPATAEILCGKGIPFQCCGEPNELVTPTGAAIVAALADAFSPLPPMKVSRIGYGAGKRETGRANMLRVFLGDTAQCGDTVAVLETCIDDSTGEMLGNCMESLLASGALDAYYTPVYMKKNRPAYQLTVLGREQDAEKLAGIIFEKTGSIGLRRRVADRLIMQRETVKVATKYGEILCKICRYGGFKKWKAEYESVKKAAGNFGVPMRDVYDEVSRAVKEI